MNIIAIATISARLAIFLFFFQAPDPQELFERIDFRALGLGMAAISFGLIGLLMTGAAFFGEQAEKAKRTWLPTTIQGLILIGITTFILTILGSSIAE